MDHRDHVKLLKPAQLSPGGAWADFGAGSGAFTLALRELVGPDASLYAIDKDQGSLRALERAYIARFGSSRNLSTIPRDFTTPLDFPPLDGVIMANSLHFFREKRSVLEGVRGYLKPEGVLLLVEYNVDRGNPWVPFPLSFETFRSLAPGAGFTEPRLLATASSSFLKEFYSALAAHGPG
jgi:SAM-dependent methyltransferase